MKRTLNQAFSLVAFSMVIFVSIIALYLASGKVQSQGYDTEEAPPLPAVL